MLGARERVKITCARRVVCALKKRHIGDPARTGPKKHRRRAARNCEGQSSLARLVDLLSVIWLWLTAVDSGLIAT